MEELLARLTWNLDCLLDTIIKTERELAKGTVISLCHPTFFNVFALVLCIPNFREACCPKSKVCRSFDLPGQLEALEAGGWGSLTFLQALDWEDGPVHVTEHPGFACKKSTLLTTLLNQISLLGGDNIFYSQLFLLKCCLRQASAVTHQQKSCFLHTRTLRWKERPSVSHPESPFLAPADPRWR